MKKHGCKTLLIVLAAMLCLFSAGGAIFAKMFSPPIGDAVMANPVGDAAMADVPVAADTEVTVGLADTVEVVEAGIEVEAEDPAAEPATDPAAKPAVDIKSTPSTVPVLTCRYFNEREFLKSVNGSVIPAQTMASESGNTPKGPVKGGIVPHHLLAGKMISAFFRDLAKDPPGTIILIAPNHNLIGDSEVHTSTADWATTFGTLEADRELAAVLIDKLKASENNTLMEDEHSISALIPYIKYYIPDAKIVPVLLHGNYTQRDSKELGGLLAEIISDRPDAVILASIDFSHYLDVNKADKMDEKTLAAISSWNMDEISMMSNDNLDSVPSVITLLTAMDTVGAKGIEVKGHSNSSRITNSGYDYTTSYYTMFFRKTD